MQRTIARWVVDHDADATRRCFDRLPVGSGCTCTSCRNFDAATGRNFPPAFSELATHLGIDPTKPAELCHYGREPSGLHWMGGWFHFVGSIESGDDVLHWENGTGTFRFEELVPGMEFGLSSRLALVAEVFSDLSLIQLEFQTRVPWVLDEPAPD